MCLPGLHHLLQRRLALSDRSQLLFHPSHPQERTIALPSTPGLSCSPPPPPPPLSPPSTSSSSSPPPPPPLSHPFLVLLLLLLICSADHDEGVCVLSTRTAGNKQQHGEIGEGGGGADVLRGRRLWTTLRTGWGTMGQARASRSTYDVDSSRIIR
eukprot:758117-Hanusia_phi.AAC.1